ncbi:ATP/GTP-binding protein [Streptomyces sp. NBC_01500]|uniref:ATP/GTP-binding protein n=1 Tax=Streptomyces sp. NBC_01500 TaxID=2903886 RepID=UPI00225B89E3|nr:ATP/GTP-binding protein [Streptomyces sp. NBC_01500]MCX4554229.1 ATP/GTP-binding protein [Streptomyces sp. NBC_01500]
MDSAIRQLTGPALSAAMPETALWLLHTVRWLTAYWYWPVLGVGVITLGAQQVIRRLADKASQERMVLELVPSRQFEPTAEEIFRRGVQLSRACGALPWWAPARTRSVRIRLRADGSRALSYRVEGPAGAERLLTSTPFGPHVRVVRAKRVPDKPRKHEVRAEFILRGNPVAELRDVPMEPDPLQPLVDAVADLRASLGDLAEVTVDIQRAPRLFLRARRWQLMDRARRHERGEFGRASRWVHQDAQRRGDSVAMHLQQLLSSRSSGPVRQTVLPPAPRRIERSEALGKLAEDVQLMRVQILVKCASNVEGRAQARLAQVQAGLDVFGDRARLAMKGVRLGPWRLGCDSGPARKRFDTRWELGQCLPPRANWVGLEELSGLLKPPTMHCRLPLLEADVPSFEFGNADLLLQGIHRGADGRERLIATYAEETLFETAVGRAGGGKTERALVQAIGVAHSGGGLMFIDPHRDSWRRAAPYLAHKPIMQRIALIDLNGDSASAQLSSWNPIGMHHDGPRHEVVEATVDAFAAQLGWDDLRAPRAITIFTAALTVLAAVNQLACRAGRPDDQATLFHVRPLLVDPDFRRAALDSVAQVLDADSASWWVSTFPTLPPDAFGVILNPLSRLAAHPVSRAFLGQPVGVYNIRAAMDQRMIVWVCTAGNGPTDRLLTSLLSRDLLRAGRSRHSIRPEHRVPFRIYMDELITLTGAAPETIASMFEDFRKYGLQVHGMTQLLSRLPGPVRQSLLQNSSSLATTAGSRSAISAITDEWGEYPSPEDVAALDRYSHYMSLTVHGRRVGPLLVEGAHLDKVFATLARPRDTGRLEHAARSTAGATDLSILAHRATSQEARVLAFLRESVSAAKVPLSKSIRGYQ